MESLVLKKMAARNDFSSIDYRFSFVLTVNDPEEGNDIIICKRDFDINNLDEESLCSLELKETVDDIVTMIDRDLKSKSRTYMWYNYDENYVTDEFKNPITETPVTIFKFTLFDKQKPVITKIWNGDVYPAAVRGSVDLTNRKYKYTTAELDFSRQIAQKGAAGRPDLTTLIMKHITTTCSSYRSRDGKEKIIYKQYLPDLNLENMAINKNDETSYVGLKLQSNGISIDENNNMEKLVYDVYTTKYTVGEASYELNSKKIQANHLK